MSFECVFIAKGQTIHPIQLIMVKHSSFFIFAEFPMEGRSEQKCQYFHIFGITKTFHASFYLGRFVVWNKINILKNQSLYFCYRGHLQNVNFVKNITKWTSYCYNGKSEYIFLSKMLNRRFRSFELWFSSFCVCLSVFVQKSPLHIKMGQISYFYTFLCHNANTEG